MLLACATISKISGREKGLYKGVKVKTVAAKMPTNVKPG